MGSISPYSSDCGYEAEVYTGAGFVVTKELRECLGCRELVGVVVSTHASGGRKATGDIVLDRCPKCGSDDLTEPRRIGVRRRVACPRCGEPMRVRGHGLWD